MRNPFRRQTETAAPSLRERAADLSVRLASTIRKAEPPTAPAEDTFAPAPTDLADACRWALRHRAWVDRSLETTDWSDEKFDTETGKTNAVITRAINEPSAQLAEIVAKAALALDDFERFQVTPHRDIDDGTRIVHTVLREVAAFQVEAGAAPVASIDFGPDAHIAELAAEFCKAYAANIAADREHMAERMSETEWRPHYEAARDLMAELEATEPKTTLGMALKCLGPIGAAGWNAPADGNTEGMDPWERVGARFADAMLAGTLTPLMRGTPCSLDLIAAAGFNLSSLSLRDVAALRDITVTLSNVVRAMQMQPRGWRGPHLNDVGHITEWLGDQLDAQIDRTVNELRSRTPADWIERDIRLEAIAEATVSNGDPEQTAAFARELLAMVEA